MDLLREGWIDTRMDLRKCGLIKRRLDRYMDGFKKVWINYVIKGMRLREDGFKKDLTKRLTDIVWFPSG